jgi:hypothetical protein
LDDKNQSTFASHYDDDRRYAGGVNFDFDIDLMM